MNRVAEIRWAPGAQAPAEAAMAGGAAGALGLASPATGGVGGVAPSAPAVPFFAEDASTRVGLMYGIAAYGWWGLVPIYFKAVAHVPALEVLAHRVAWSAVLLIVLMRWLRRWPTALDLVRGRRTRVALAATTVIIAINWGVFIWAVQRGWVLQASLGYFINPLVNVLLGYVFLRERLAPWQKVSVALAACGVTYMASGAEGFPWLAMVLATSFGFYGLLRKWARIDALGGLTIETLALLPASIAYLWYAQATGGLSFWNVSRGTDLLLILGGVITAVPLLWFGHAAGRLRLATLGFLQYIAPTGQFLLAVLAYGETFTVRHGVSFAFIWTALVIYSADMVVRARRRAKGPLI